MGICMTMVAMSSDAPVSADALVAELTRQWPGIAVSDLKQDSTSFSFAAGDIPVVAALMPAPIPWSSLEVPCQTSLFWKEAGEVLRGHVCHWLLTTIGPARSPREHFETLTRATAAMLATSPHALGVFWPSADLVISPRLFRDMATGMELPVWLWVGFRVGPEGPAASSGFTIGLQAFGLMEIEAPKATEKSGDLLDRLFGLAGYLIGNGPVIQDGHTVGQSAEEKIRVRYAPSVFGHQEPVMRLEFEEAEKPKRTLWNRLGLSKLAGR